MRIGDDERVAIAYVKVTTTIVGRENRRGKWHRKFVYDQTRAREVSADSIAFEVHGGCNVMGGQSSGPTQLDAVVIRCLPDSDRLLT